MSIKMNPEFYKERIEKSNSLEDAVQGGVNWEEVRKKHGEIIKKLVKGKVFDAGCGLGRMAEFIDKENYVGMDWTPEFIEEARKRYPEHTFLLGDFTKTDFNNFDWAITGSLGGYLEEALTGEKALSRIARNILVLWLSKPSEYKIISYGNTSF